VAKGFEEGVVKALEVVVANGFEEVLGSPKGLVTFVAKGFVVLTG